MTQIRSDQIISVPNGKRIAALWKADMTEATVANTLVETNLCSFTITGGLMGANDALILQSFGSITSTVANTAIIRGKYGGTTMCATPAITFGGSAAVFNYYNTIWLKNVAVTNSQKMVMVVDFDGTNSPQQGTAAIDSTLPQTFTVTCQWSVANAGAVAIHYGITVLYIPAV